MAFEFKGMKEILGKLNERFEELGGRPTTAALLKAAIIIRRDMEKTSPKVPVDTNNLRASWFVVTNQGEQTGVGSGMSGKGSKKQHSTVTGAALQKVKGRRPKVITGFSANYATYVHEVQGKTYQRPGAGPKFLESALERNAGVIMKTLQESLKKK